MTLILRDYFFFQHLLSFFFLSPIFWKDSAHFFQSYIWYISHTYGTILYIACPMYNDTCNVAYEVSILYCEPWIMQHVPRMTVVWPFLGRHELMSVHARQGSHVRPKKRFHTYPAEWTSEFIGMTDRSMGVGLKGSCMTRKPTEAWVATEESCIPLRSWGQFW